MNRDMTILNHVFDQSFIRIKINELCSIQMLTQTDFYLKQKQKRFNTNPGCYTGSLGCRVKRLLVDAFLPTIVSLNIKIS